MGVKEVWFKRKKTHSESRIHDLYEQGDQKNKTYGGKNEIQERTGFHPYRAPREDYLLNIRFV